MSKILEGGTFSGIFHLHYGIIRSAKIPLVPWVPKGTDRPRTWQETPVLSKLSPKKRTQETSSQAAVKITWETVRAPCASALTGPAAEYTAASKWASLRAEFQGLGKKHSFAGPSQKRIGQSWVFQPCPDRKHFLLQAMTSSCQVTNMSWISNVRLKGCETTLTSALSMKLPGACSEGDLVSIICWNLNKQNALGSFRGRRECNLYIQNCSQCTATTFLHITEGRVQNQAHAERIFVI